MSFGEALLAQLDQVELFAFPFLCPLEGIKTRNFMFIVFANTFLLN